MQSNSIFTISNGNVHAIPILHYKMEMAALVCQAIQELQPDCIAVEFAETMQSQLIRAAGRLPDLSVVIAENQLKEPIYYLAEPCDPCFEALRRAQELGIAAYCVDLDVDFYPEMIERVPDCYAVEKIGLKSYYELYQETVLHPGLRKHPRDEEREFYMARRLKELSLSYDRVLFIGGMFHVQSIMQLLNRSSFPVPPHSQRTIVELITLSQKSAQEVMAECGWFTCQYEKARQAYLDGNKEESFPLDRQKLILQLYRAAASAYKKNTGNSFESYHLRNTMKFARNYALLTGNLMPDLFQILSAAKGCVDHNYAYEVFELSTLYPYLRNIDGLPEVDLSIEEIWGHEKNIRFHLKEKSRKAFTFYSRPKDFSSFHFDLNSHFSICSYPPEDLVIEKFGDFLKKKGTQIVSEESARVIPFTTSIEDGIDTKETIRHFAEKKLYVKTKGKPSGGVGSVVIIFDEDSPEEGKPYQEKYPWYTTWLGEHSQESDMAFYATPMTANVVGPGICRCEYGGFMMSYPPRRLMDVWTDPDYEGCRTKSEVLLVSAIDYAQKPLIVYVASKPPRSKIKSFAKRYGKKIVYIPIGQLSRITVNNLRVFHVLDGRNRRENAHKYIRKNL